MLGAALSSMKQVVDIDEQGRGVYEQLMTIEDLLSDSIRSVNSYAESLDFSEEDHERVRLRLDTINALKMKYGQSVEKINEKLAEESAKIEKLSDYEHYLEGLSKEVSLRHDEVLKLCGQISKIRKKEALIPYASRRSSTRGVISVLGPSSKVRAMSFSMQVPAFRGSEAGNTVGVHHGVQL